MKHSIIIFSASLLISFSALAQGTDGVLIDPNNATTRDASAVFQAQSTSQGVLVPRMTAAQRGAITVDATRNGLMVYQTDGTPGFYYYNGATLAWVQLATSTGGTGYIQNQVAADQSAGFRINGNGLFNGGSVGIGTTTPGGKLEVVGGAIVSSNGYIDLNRDAFAKNGLSWYSQSYPSWSTYMSPGAATATGPHGDLTAPSGTFVTSWAMRDYIENAAGYGWTFESAANTTTPAVKFEIRSSDGLFHGYGDGIIDNNVGIGINAPTHKLHISTATGEEGIIVSAATYPELIFQTAGTTRSYIGIAGSAGGYGTGTLANSLILRSEGAAVHIITNAGTIALTANAGNVGIGTTSPGFKLHVPSGYIGTDYINTSDDNTTVAAVSGIMVKQGDNYHRTGTAAKVAAFLNSSIAASYANLTGIPTRTAWSGVHRNFVAEQLSWKNYGNNHTIFDASASTSPDGTAINNTNPAVNWSATYPTLMGWNGASTYGVRVDVARYAESAGSAPGDNLGNHTATTTLSMAANLISNAGSVNITAGDGNGIRFWQDDNYKIHMGNGADYHYGPVTDYSIKMNMNNQALRGWTWGVNGVVPVAALECQTGNMQIKGTFYSGTTGWSANQLHFSSGWGAGGYHATIGSGYTGISASGIMLGAPHVPWRASYGSKVRFASDQAASFYWDWGMNGEGGGSTDRFDLNRNNSNLFSVLNNGNVGIANAAPNYKLVVNGDIYANGGWMRVSGNQGLYLESWGGGWHMTDGTWIRGYNGKSLWMAGGLIGGDGGLTIGYGGASPPANGAIIAGNVAIGKNSANAKFDVSGNGGSDGLVIYQQQDNTTTIQTYIDGQYANRATYASACCNDLFIQPDVGSVIIGGTANTNSGYKLFVNGRMRSNGYIEPSDSRLKKDITPIVGALDKVIQMQGVNYKWRKDLPQNEGQLETNQFGLIAQELEKIVPELVHTDNQGWKSVEYSHLVPLLIESIKEQQAEIESQKITINSQQKIITASADDINLLKNITKELAAKITSISDEIHTTGNK